MLSEGYIKTTGLAPAVWRNTDELEMFFLLNKCNHKYIKIFKYITFLENLEGDLSDF